MILKNQTMIYKNQTMILSFVAYVAKLKCLCEKFFFSKGVDFWWYLRKNS